MDGRALHCAVLHAADRRAQHPPQHRFEFAQWLVRVNYLGRLSPKDGLNKLRPAIPAKAGIQRLQRFAESLDPSFRWDDDLFKHSLNRPGAEAGHAVIPSA